MEGKHQLSPQEQEERKQHVLTHGSPAVVRSIAEERRVDNGAIWLAKLASAGIYAPRHACYSSNPMRYATGGRSRPAW
jgi:hypothetical protein